MKQFFKKRTIAAILVAVAVVFAFLWKREVLTQPDSSESVEELPSRKPAPPTLVQSGSSLKEMATPATSPPHESPIREFHTVQEIETWAKSLASGAREKRIWSAFGESKPGRQLAAMFTISSAYHYDQKLAPVLDALSDAYRPEFLGQPDLAAQEIEHGLGALSREDFAMERTALIGTLGTLPGHRSAAKALAFREAAESAPPARAGFNERMSEEEKNQILSTQDPVYRYPVMVASHYFSFCESAAEAKRGAQDMLARQEDPGVREGIRSQLAQRLKELH